MPSWTSRSVCDTDPVASRQPSRLLMLASVAWVIFGAWVLFRPATDVAGLDPIVGHVVVFFFACLATLGLLVRPLGVVRALLVGVVGVGAVALASELLQPILTETRLAQREDFLGNVAGIVGAVGVTVVLVAAFRSATKREVATALMCCVGLVGSAVALGGGVEAVREFVDCRNSTLESVDGVGAGPVIEVVGDEVRVGTAAASSLGDGIIADDSVDLRCSVMASKSYSIVATVVPDSLDSGGPTRIFTSSQGTNFDEYNTHIGQDFDELSVRIRSGDGQQWESVPGVFEAGQRVTVAIVVAAGRVEVLVDGEWRAEFELEGASFFAWDPTYPILIGDELTRNRTFEGVIEHVSFFDRALDSDVDAPLLVGSGG